MINFNNKYTLDCITLDAKSLLDAYTTEMVGDSADKIRYLDVATEFLLEQYCTTWREDLLYSWHSNSESTHKSVSQIYGNDGVRFMNTHSVISKDVQSTFYTIKNSLLSSVDNREKFILEMHMNIFKHVTPYVLVVSNIQPNPKFFSEGQLCSMIGKWNLGL